MAAKSPRSCRKTVVFTSLSSDEPACSRIARRFANTCSVWLVASPPSSSFEPGFRASWPDTNTKPFALIACEYGAPWNGAGADSVRTTSLAIERPFSLRLGLGRPAGEPKGGADGLEHREQHVLRVLALEQAHVQVQAGAEGELLQEARDDVGGEPRHALAGEVDVGCERRAVVELERRGGEGLVGGRERPADPRGAVGTQELAEGAAER